MKEEGGPCGPPSLRGPGDDRVIWDDDPNPLC